MTVVIPTLHTRRLTLRAPLASDFEAYAAFRASPRTALMGGPYDRSDAFHQFCALWGHWQARGFGRWMIADRDSDDPLGVVGLFHPEDWPEPEIAWSLFDKAEGQGIAFEAALAARDFAYRELHRPAAPRRQPMARGISRKREPWRRRRSSCRRRRWP